MIIDLSLLKTSLAVTRPPPHDAGPDWPCVECGHRKINHTAPRLGGPRAGVRGCTCGTCDCQGFR